MSGLSRLLRSNSVLFQTLLAFLLLASLVANAAAQQRRERESNSVYAERRAKLAAQVDAPVVLWGLTGREESSQTSIFAQEENFYYLTGHNEEGAGLIILPAPKEAAAASGATNNVAASGLPNAAAVSSVRDNVAWNGPREILFLPPKDAAKEKWNGVRMAPSDPGIAPHIGFAAVEPFPEMRVQVERLAKVYSGFYTVLPYETELGGYPHEKDVVQWLNLAVPQVNLKDIRAQITALRQIKGPGELAFLKRAIELSLDSHVEAMKIMRPGLYEYQVGAKMVEVHQMGGSESEAYAPIVGAGPNSTALHYDQLSRKIEDGDIVVLDVAAQFSGYAADITRTIPANGKFTLRQREIYDIVLGAQNAALAVLKPGMTFCKDKSVHKIAYDYINSHGKDLHGKSLGQYFIHGLGHHMGLNVHDPGDHCRPFLPGMVVTVEPGIYIPEENLGVRIEDDVLITETGNQLLSERLPRNADDIEKIMAEAAARRAKEKNGSAAENVTSPSASADADAIRGLIAKYATSVDAADTALAAQVWSNSPDVSFINPVGHEHGFEQIKKDVYTHLMGETFSERKLSVHDVSLHIYGDAAWAEFYWDFAAKFRKDGAPVESHGWETQIYRKQSDGWRLVHVHYSAAPVTTASQ
jgi:Xaa-Pro aminopeptidase